MAIFRRSNARTLDAAHTQSPVAPLTAKDLFGVMLKEHVGPRLRELGFRGSAGVYTRPDPNHFIRIGFQKSSYGTSQHVKFTLNVSAIDKAGWTEARAQKSYLPTEPSANTFYGAAHWQRRIGELMPPQDREPWWELSPGADVSALAIEVLGVIEGFAIPAIDKETSNGR